MIYGIDISNHQGKGGIDLDKVLTKNPKTNEDELLFYCPCHGDTFYLNGERVMPENSKSARSLDSLDARVDESGKVFVKFQNFQLGTAEKKPV